jgi:hypothetical protein
MRLKPSDTHCWTECSGSWKEIDRKHYVPSIVAHHRTVRGMPYRGHSLVSRDGGYAGVDEPMMVSCLCLQACVYLTVHAYMSLVSRLKVK